MYDSDNVVVEKGEWLNHICVDGTKVRHIITGLKGGEAGAYYTADLTTDIGIDSNGDLLVVKNNHLVRSTFGLFPREVKGEYRSIYERK